MSKPLDTGTQRLVDDLLEKPQSFGRDEMIARARKLLYHDYKSPYAAPDGVLIKHLARAGYPDLALLVLEDRYAQPSSEVRAYEQTPEGKIAAELASDPVAAAAMDGLMKASKLNGAEVLKWVRQCIEDRKFKHPVFDDTKVRDPRKAN